MGLYRQIPDNVLKRVRRIHICMTEDEAEVLQGRASAVGLPLSVYIRAMLVYDGNPNKLRKKEKEGFNSRR